MCRPQTHFHALSYTLTRACMHSRGKAMPSCLCVCLLAKNASSRLAKAFTGVIPNRTSDVSVPDTSKGGSFRHYFSCFLLSVSWLHPFRNCTWHHRLHALVLAWHSLRCKTRRPDEYILYSCFHSSFLALDYLHCFFIILH